MTRTPRRSPLVPKTTRSFHFPKTPDEFDLGFPPPSHAHLNRRVPPGNEELPESQAALTDFGRVLRKKHAVNDASDERRRRQTVIGPASGLFPL